LRLEGPADFDLLWDAAFDKLLCLSRRTLELVKEESLQRANLKALLHKYLLATVRKAHYRRQKRAPEELPLTLNYEQGYDLEILLAQLDLTPEESDLVERIVRRREGETIKECVATEDEYLKWYRLKEKLRKQLSRR